MKAVISLLFVIVMSLFPHLLKGFRLAARRSITRTGVAARGVVKMASSSDPPAEPINFVEKFRMPVNDEKLLLEVMNAHPLDSKISFDEEAHEYFYEGNPISISVTGLVENFFEKFDADLVARKMINGNNWPREGYTRKDGTPYTEQEIKKKWDEIGLYARNRGTWMHYNIERYFNNMRPSDKLEEFPLFLKFNQEVIMPREIQPWRTEWRIAAPDIDLAGSVDFVGRLPDGTFALLDWKRAKDLASKTENKYRRGKYPVGHLDDCDVNKYFLQLNMYRYILQNYYGVQVSLMGLASFHPSKDDYYFAEVPVMDAEIQAIISVTQEEKNNRVMSPEYARSDSMPVDIWGPPRARPSANGGNSGLPLPSNNRPTAPAPAPAPAYVPASQRYPNPNQNTSPYSNQSPSPNSNSSPRPGQMRPPQTTNMNELPF